MKSRILPVVCIASLCLIVSGCVMGITYNGSLDEGESLVIGYWERHDTGKKGQWQENRSMMVRGCWLRFGEERVNIDEEGYFAARFKDLAAGGSVADFIFVQCGINVGNQMKRISGEVARFPFKYKANTVFVMAPRKIHFGHWRVATVERQEIDHSEAGRKAVLEEFQKRFPDDFPNNFTVVFEEPKQSADKK